MVGKKMVDIFRIHELAACLARLHEIHVVLKQRGVKNRLHAHVVADVRHGKHVLKRDRLAADKVCASLDTYEGHILRTNLTDATAKILKVEISLERVVALRKQTLRIDKLLHCAAQTGDVSLRSGEMEVHQSHLARRDVCLGKNILTGATLMRRQDIVRVEHLLHRSLDTVEGL